MSDLRRLRIGLLVCGHVHRDALDLGGDYPELFGALFAPLGAEIVPFDLVAGEGPSGRAELDAIDLWMTSPARASVTDDDAWIRDAEALVRRLVAQGRPFAGICFGHQLLATALGGRVERAATGWGVGAHTYDVVAPQPWMDRSERFTLIASHEDQVVELPPGATLLATSSHCPVAMFAVGDRAIGLQPHPEFTAALSRRLTGMRRDLIGEQRADVALASLTTPLDRERVAGWLVRFAAERTRQ